MSFEMVSNSPEATHNLAQKLATKLSAGDLLTLEGDLGAGKTTFTKGLAKGLGITRNVNSPTFTIIKEYQGRIPLYHMDVYRVADSFEELGFEEYFEGDGVTVVEWSHLISDQLPTERLEVNIYHVGNESRKLTFHPIGERYLQICEELFKDESISD
ncbi:tRNA (adenosine(37)-N6)-threonylcarbamoyltransferase complex ATPase subunit type 1 TsaE [Bacillus timonensis]|nr:tRNA (adenosine(37)-N6)-threonylcarbamoyltransferase complex ATPase subunit type 1 TsaE [Bacillus timonensis]